MRTPCRKQRWLGFVADANGATLYAVEGTPPGAALVALGRVRYELEALGGRASLPELERFVEEQALAGCPAHLHFAGAGTVVHKLHMPPLSVRRRGNAIRTRLTAYAAGRELCINERVDPRRRDEKDVHVLAAGTDACLVRGLFAALRRAGLRVGTVTAFTAACGPPTDAGRSVQVVLGERTTAIQLFCDGRLSFCRDVLFGRADFVAAYQRPILTRDGPLSLSAEQAERLVCEVGVPSGPGETGLESVRAEQLWPLISPVLQRLHSEIEQTLAQHWKLDEMDASLSVLCLPTIPGLGEYLASELGLSGSLVPDERVAGEFLTALHGGRGRAAPLDLSPAEERFAKRMARPAAAAALCAVLIMLGNAGAPRAARAERGHLEPTTASLQSRLAEVQVQLTAARADHDELVSALTSTARLARALPPTVPAIAVCRALFQTVPDNVELLDVSLEADATPVGVELLGSYRGESAAGVVAAGWARQLANAAFCADAEVTSVDGSGRGERATIAIRASLR